MKFLRLACAMVACCVALGTVRADDFKLKLIAFNDFHGYLESPGKMRANGLSQPVDVGGADFIAGYIEKLKSQDPYNVVVSAGDLIGAAPLISSLFHNESTIEVMNRLGLEISAVGNHEFDKGPQELLRMQHGGCSTLDQDTCAARLQEHQFLSRAPNSNFSRPMCSTLQPVRLSFQLTRSRRIRASKSLSSV